MSEQFNPFYSPEKLNLTLFSFDEPGLCYEYNTLCFWEYNGQIYTAEDSGCSCPTPFENYSGENTERVLTKLDRVGSVEQALSTFDSWNKDYNGRPFMSITDRNELIGWITSKLK